MRKLKIIIKVIWPFVFIVFLCILFFYKSIVFGNIPAPSDTLVGLYHPWRDHYASLYPRGIPFKNFLITDPVRQQIPWRKSVVDAWKQMHIPSWNPYSLLGMSLAGNIQAAPFYIFNSIFLLFPFLTAWTLLIILQILLGGIFMYVYLFDETDDLFSSLFGSVSWMFSGFSIAWLTWGTLVHVSLWVPLGLLFINRLLAAEKRKNTILSGIGLALSIYCIWTAGHGQIAFYATVLLAFYGIKRYIFMRKHQVIVTFPFIASFLSGIVASSIQIIPYFNALKESSRAIDASGWLKDGWFIPIQHVVQFISPDYFGNPATMNYWGVWNYGEFVGYVSIVLLPFVLLSLIFSSLKKDFFWKIVFTVSLLFSFDNPIAGIPYILHIPFIRSLQPTRLLFLIDLSLIMLAVSGMRVWITNRILIIKPVVLSAILIGIVWAVTLLFPQIFPDSASRIVSLRNLVFPSAVYIILIILTGLSFIPYFRPDNKSRYILLCIIGLVAIDLIRFGWKFTPFTPREYFFPETQTIAYLRNELDSEPFRIAPLDSRMFPPNVNSYYGIESVSGYDPVHSARTEQLLLSIESGKPVYGDTALFERIIEPVNWKHPLFPLLNVKYILALTDIQDPILNLVYSEGTSRVYKYSHMLPRVFIADNVIISETKPLEQMFQSDYDPSETVVLEEPVSVGTESLLPDEEVRITTYKPDRIIMKANVHTRRILVVSSSYSPEWRVNIDGLEEKIYIADYALIGIPVPEGKHLIELYYSPFL